MNIYPVLQLIGMAVEILAAFMLSAEAIGLSRLDSWTRSLTQVTGELSGQANPSDSLKSPSVGRIIFTIIVATGSGAGGWFGGSSRTWFPHVPTLLLLLLGGVVGAITGVVLLYVVVYTSLAVITFLKAIESYTQRRIVGVIGFLLLLLGFMLQFIGTLALALRPPGSSI